MGLTKCITGLVMLVVVGYVGFDFAANMYQNKTGYESYTGEYSDAESNSSESDSDLIVKLPQKRKWDQVSVGSNQDDLVMEDTNAESLPNSFQNLVNVPITHMALDENNENNDEPTTHLPPIKLDSKETLKGALDEFKDDDVDGFNSEY